MPIDYLSEAANDALAGIARVVLEDAASVKAIKDDDNAVLAIEGGELATLGAAELLEAVAAGDIWDDGDIYYLSEDAFGTLVGQELRAAVPAGIGGHMDMVYKFDEVLFDAGEGTRRGWVSFIMDASQAGPDTASISVEDDSGTDWNVLPGDISEIRG